MRYGFIHVSNDVSTVGDLAALAEQHGWDGFFCWDGIWATDVWVMLAVAATRTERIRLGTMLTPVPRKRPWDLAAQTATVDTLSGGRLTLAVGLGVTGEDRWWYFEDDPGRRARAEQLDEGLTMLELLWGGEPFAFSGTHFRTTREIAEIAEIAPPVPRPVQAPRVPIWVVGAWPRKRSMRRAARWDGLLPAYAPKGGDRTPVDDADGLTPDVLAEAVAWIRSERRDQGLPDNAYDVVWEGTTPADDPKAAARMVQPWADAGATWWLEADWSGPSDRASVARRIMAGPPRID